MARLEDFRTLYLESSEIRTGIVFKTWKRPSKYFCSTFSWNYNNYNNFENHDEYVIKVCLKNDMMLKSADIFMNYCNFLYDNGIIDTYFIFKLYN